MLLRAGGWMGGGGGVSVVARAEGNRGEDIGSDFCVFFRAHRLFFLVFTHMSQE